MEKRSVKVLLWPAILAAAICVLILLQNDLEARCIQYAMRTYYYVPLYGTRLAFCVVWAVGLRVLLAVHRRKAYRGKPRFMLPALLATAVLVVLGAVDWFYLTRKLMWMPLFDVCVIESLLCLVMRRKTEE